MLKRLQYLVNLDFCLQGKESLRQCSEERNSLTHVLHFGEFHGVKSSESKVIFFLFWVKQQYNKHITVNTTKSAVLREISRKTWNIKIENLKLARCFYPEQILTVLNLTKRELKIIGYFVKRFDSLLRHIHIIRYH